MSTINRRVLKAEASGWWVRGRPKLGLMDGLKLVLDREDDCGG